MIPTETLVVVEAVIVLIAFLGDVQGGDDCNLTKFEYFNSKYGICSPCPDCPKGKGRNIDFDNRKATITIGEHGAENCLPCLDCIKGESFNDGRSALCDPCTDFAKDFNRDIGLPCTRKRNALPGDCHPGYEASCRDCRCTKSEPSSTTLTTLLSQSVGNAIATNATNSSAGLEDHSNPEINKEVEDPKSSANAVTFIALFIVIGILFVIFVGMNWYVIYQYKCQSNTPGVAPSCSGVQASPGGSSAILGPADNVSDGYNNDGEEENQETQSLLDAKPIQETNRPGLVPTDRGQESGSPRTDDNERPQDISIQMDDSEDENTVPSFGNTKLGPNQFIRNAEIRASTQCKQDGTSEVHGELASTSERGRELADQNFVSELHAMPLKK